MALRERTENSAALVVWISPERPPEAKDLAKLLLALAKDYSVISGGRTLVISDVSRGSILLQLADAWATYGQPTLEIIAAVNGINEFAKILKKGLDYFRTSRGADEKGPNADNSLLEIFKLAAKSDAEIEVWQKTRDGTETILKVASDEARKLKRKPKRQQKKDKEPKGHLIARSESLLPSIRIDQMSPEKLAEAMIAIADLEQSEQGTTLIQMVELVRSHFSGQLSILNEIARNLWGKGRSELAARLLDEPPLHQITQSLE